MIACCKYLILVLIRTVIGLCSPSFLPFDAKSYLLEFLKVFIKMALIRLCGQLNDFVDR